MAQKPLFSSSAALRRCAAIQARIARRPPLVAAGTLQVRLRACGNPNCRCAKDPANRHGPYYEWTKLVNKRLVNIRLSSDQAKIVREAIANYKTVQALLASWERISMASLTQRRFSKPR